MSSREPQLRRLYHAAVSVGEKLYIWAGSDYSGRERVRTTTVERFDVSTESWLQPRRLRGTLPKGLQGMAVTLVDETAYTFGGEAWTGREFIYFNKLFQINLSTMQCREVKPELHCQAPKEMSFSGMVHFNHMLVVHGGCCQYGQERTDEVHVFNLQTRVWSVQPTTGEKPPPMSHHTFIKIDHHRAVVIAGIVGWTPCNDIYVLDMQTWHWTKPEVSGDKPLPRYSHAACYMTGPLTGQQHPLVLVTGGHSDQGDLGDVWLLDVDKLVWREMVLPVSITSRESHSACVFGSGPGFRAVVLFGGCNHQDESLAETTLLLLDIRPHTLSQSASCQVTRVVKTDELGKSVERFKEQMRKLELPSQEVEGAVGQVDTCTAADAREEKQSNTKTCLQSESHTEEAPPVTEQNDTDVQPRRSLRKRKRTNRFGEDPIGFYKPSD